MIDNTDKNTEKSTDKNGRLVLTNLVKYVVCSECLTCDFHQNRSNCCSISEHGNTLKTHCPTLRRIVVTELN